MPDCKHIVTRGHKCVDCGVQVYDLETRKCGDCSHFVQVHDLGCCDKHSMFVHKDMLVTFKLTQGSCFEAVAGEGTGYVNDR